MCMLDTKTKTLSWTPDLSGLLPTRELQSQGHFRGSVRVRACVCVCEHVFWGRELFTGGWRRGAVNSTVKRPGRRKTRSVVSKALLF